MGNRSGVAVQRFEKDIRARQEIDLLPCQNANGKNLRVGVAAAGAVLNGIVSRDEQNNFSYLPISGDLNFQNFPASLQEVLYALTPPDANNNVTAVVIVSNPAVPDGFDLGAAMNDAVPDALNQNGWTVNSYSVQTVSSGVQFPPGTQFWVYSSTGTLTLAGDPAIFLTDAMGGTFYKSVPLAGVPTDITVSRDQHWLAVIYSNAGNGYVEVFSIDAYGDLTPVHPLARSLANLEAGFGMLFPATFIARLVALRSVQGDADPE